MATPSVVPRADGEGKIGTSIKRWSEGHYDQLELGHPTRPITGYESFIICASDETTAITTGDDKVRFTMPYSFHVEEIKATLSATSTSGNVTVQVTENGAANNITSAAISITAGAVLGTTTTFGSGGGTNPDANIPEDAVVGVNIDGAGTAAKGLKVMIIGYRSNHTL